jgi:hypothetical protein
VAIRRARDRQGNIIEPMTLSNMRSLGVRNVKSRCEACGPEAVVAGFRG